MSNFDDREPPPLIRALLRPEAYDHPVDNIELVETHISWVLLTGRFAYKIKKPINLGFVDFSTLKRRRRYCHEEIRLNRRLAPDIYLKVALITGSIDSPRLSSNGGEPIEFAVKMIQFSRTDELDRLVERGELTRSHMETLARMISTFHESVDRAAEDSVYGNSEQVIQPVKENFNQIRQRISDPESLEEMEQVERWSREQFQLLATLFERRKEEGYVRECHGDLHLANMAWIDGKPLVFDCIEFNPSLRWIDVLSEIAFLTMDLEERGCAELAYAFLNAYLELGGDYPGLPVLNFYFSYRLMVRAKVEAIRAYQQPRDSDSRLDAEGSFRTYLQLAVKHTQPGSPRLIITCGLSGSGKSSLTQSLLGSLQAIRIRSDVERKRLFGLSAGDDGKLNTKLSIYRPEATERTYEKLIELANTGLDSGFSIIIDATCLKAEQRTAFQVLAAKKQVPYSILNVTAPEEVLRERLEKRESGASDADVAVMKEQLSLFEPFGEEERPFVIPINSESSVDLEGLVSEIDSSKSIPPEGNHGDFA